MLELPWPLIWARRSSPAQRPSSRGSRESAVIGGSKKARYSESSNVITEMSLRDHQSERFQRGEHALHDEVARGDDCGGPVGGSDNARRRDLSE